MVLIILFTIIIIFIQYRYLYLFFFREAIFNPKNNMPRPEIIVTTTNGKVLSFSPVEGEPF